MKMLTSSAGGEEVRDTEDIWCDELTQFNF